MQKKQCLMLLTCTFYSKIILILCSICFHPHFNLLVIKKISLHFKDEIKPSVKANDRLKFTQYVEINSVIDKVKTRCTLSYRLFKKEYVDDPLIHIYPFPKIIQLKYFLGEVHHCVLVVGKWIFDRNYHFALPLTQ